MTHGSTVTYKRHSFRYFPPIAPVAAVSACISACAVGSASVFGQVVAASTIRSPYTTTAPDGHFSFIKDFAGFVQSLPHEKIHRRFASRSPEIYYL